MEKLKLEECLLKMKKIGHTNAMWQSKMLWVMIVLSLFLIVLSSISVSALGNVASWDKDPIENNGNHYAYGHYKIKDLWGIPVISSTIADYSLIYNTDKCNVGNECKAIGEAILYDDTPLFNDVLVYTVLSAGKFGFYNRTSNVWTDLSATDTGDWVGSLGVNDVAVNPNN